MNKTFIKVLALALTFGAVVACDATNSVISSTNKPTSTPSTTTTENVTVLGNDSFERAKTTYVDSKGNEKSLNMQTLYTNAGAPHLDSLEEQRVLVVPFGFDDSSTIGLQTQANLDRINTTFFANA